MQNKLQELTEKLYSEGLSKGKQEAEELKAKAKKEAEEIVKKANEQYKDILEKAKQDALDFRLKTENEIRMTAKQALATVKQNIEDILVAKAVDAPLKGVMDNKEFIGNIIKEAISAFNPKNSDAVDLEVLLPESRKEELDNYLKSTIASQFKTGLEFGYDKKIQTGFKIGPKGESYHISFTEKDFQGLLSQYMKPKTREFLFSE
ncbi:MAG: hypothetical protein PHO51_06915 [Bacteroidales bacterium]|nr:hypothetical protein [Bacteroidales bacterium]